MVMFCPNCKSTDIRSDYSFAASEYYICNNCGYRSTLFPETEDLSKVKIEKQDLKKIDEEKNEFKRIFQKIVPFILLVLYVLTPVIIALYVIFKFG